MCCGSRAPTMPASPRRWWSSASCGGEEPDRRDLGREKFLEKVWAWKAESGGAIVSQLKRLGASCDWSRERFTMDEGLVARPCQGFRGALPRGADLQGQAAGQLGPEAADRDLRPSRCAGRDGQGPPLSHFKYPLSPTRHDRDGRDRRDSSSVATTRPETMLGDTAVAVHPEDERYRASGRQEGAAAAGRPADPDRRRRIFRSRKGHRRGQDHARARFQRFRGRDAPRSVPLINILDAEARVSLQGQSRPSCRA